MVRIYDWDLMPKPIMARRIGPVWLGKLFPGRVLEVKPLEGYIKILDPQGCAMWLTINRPERIIRFSHKILLAGDCAFDEFKMHQVIGQVNAKTRYTRFILMRGEKGYFVYSISAMPMQERLRPLSVLRSFDSHWNDFRRGFNKLACHTLRAPIQHRRYGGFLLPCFARFYLLSFIQRQTLGKLREPIDEESRGSLLWSPPGRLYLGRRK